MTKGIQELSVQHLQLVHKSEIILFLQGSTQISSLHKYFTIFYCYYFSHSGRCAVISYLRLICVSLMPNDTEHLFMYLLVMSIPSSVKCLFTFCVHVLIRVFIYCWICKFFIYSSEGSFVRYVVWKTFFNQLCLFVLLTRLLVEQKC